MEVKVISPIGGVFKFNKRPFESEEEFKAYSMEAAHHLSIEYGGMSVTLKFSDGTVATT